MDQIRNAVITSYFPERGYGFLLETTVDGKKNNLFFHVTTCQGFVPEIGNKVTFKIGSGRKGVAAVDIELVGGAL
jgi:cold shock CspA family protein